MMFVHVGLVWSVEVSRFKDNNENGKSETKKSRNSNSKGLLNYLNNYPHQGG